MGLRGMFSNIIYDRYYFIILAFILSILLTSTAQATIIHGTVYDVLLEQQSNVHLRINTLPQQSFISKNGSYYFNAPIGNYVITAQTLDGYAQEGISILEEGEYNIDIILDPVLDEPETDPGLNDNITVSTEPLGTNDNHLALTIGMAIILVLVIIIAFMLITTNKRSEAVTKTIEKVNVQPLQKSDTNDTVAVYDEYAKKVLSMIKKDHRITQKDLRKQMPLSEGKISLIVSELEYSGKIKKIKKGRGNILVFVKE